MKLAAKLNKQNFLHWAKTLRYSLYVITHPFDGFWDLTHEKRGSLSAANTILVLTLLTSVWRLQFTSFIVFPDIRWRWVNIPKQMASILLPILVACVANWSLCTLFDGKGRLRDIYMGFCYALTPYVIIQLPITFLSNLFTEEEMAFYDIFSTLSFIWIGLLLLSAVMMIHDYGLGKALACSIATVLAMGIIIFITLLFFSLITDAIFYFVSLYKEVVYRLY